MDTTKPQMSGRERILAALNHQPVDRLPFTPAVDSYLMMGLPPELTGDPNLDYMHPKRQLATMKNFAIHEAEKALDASSSEKLVASYMKSTFEKRYKGVWHCIAGRNFGGYVTHET